MTLAGKLLGESVNTVIDVSERLLQFFVSGAKNTKSEIPRCKKKSPLLLVPHIDAPSLVVSSANNSKVGFNASTTWVADVNC